MGPGVNLGLREGRAVKGVGRRPFLAAAFAETMVSGASNAWGVTAAQAEEDHKMQSSLWGDLSSPVRRNVIKRKGFLSGLLARQLKIQVTGN